MTLKRRSNVFSTGCMILKKINLNLRSVPFILLGHDFIYPPAHESDTAVMCDASKRKEGRKLLFVPPIPHQNKCKLCKLHPVSRRISCSEDTYFSLFPFSLAMTENCSSGSFYPNNTSLPFTLNGFGG